MTLEVAFRNLAAKLTVVRDELKALGLTVVEDKPAGGSVLVDGLGDLVMDLSGSADDALARAFQAGQAAAHSADLHAARAGLAEANLSVIRLQHRFFEDAVSYRAIDDLGRDSRTRGREWLAWSQSVVQALDACRTPLRDLDEALLETWVELADRMGGGPVSARTSRLSRETPGA